MPVKTAPLTLTVTRRIADTTFTLHTTTDSADAAVAWLDARAGATPDTVAKGALTAKGRAAIAFLDAHADLTATQIAAVAPGLHSSLRWLAKHGFIAVDVPTQRYTVLRRD